MATDRSKCPYCNDSKNENGCPEHGPFYAMEGPRAALDRLENRVIKLERFGFEVDGRFIEGGGGRNWVRIQDVLAAIRAEREGK